jgi:1-aminocyclopropane-1-carboxylate deaminase/D-cysteine desulfhydrase-like pyridoxal-dependent ACC family enzyme
MPLGGNKTRMFEYVLPRALAAGADCVVAGAAIQSNYCRQLAAACAQVGLEVYLVLRSVRPDVETVPQGNFLLDLLMDAHVYIVENMGWPEQVEQIYLLAERLKATGRRPYVARAANQEDIGLDAAAYANCALELHQQLAEQNIKPDYLYVAAADTTQGGLLLGAKILGESYQIVGLNPLGEAAFGGPPASDLIIHAAGKAAAELGLSVTIDPEEVACHSLRVCARSRIAAARPPYTDIMRSLPAADSPGNSASRRRASSRLWPPGSIRFRVTQASASNRSAFTTKSTTCSARLR